MPTSVAALAAAKLRNRSVEARRAAHKGKFERERLIVGSLNCGVSVAEIARRIGVTEKRMRALVKEIFARRMPAAPEDVVALHASRLNEALLVACGAMADKNLRAVDLVVRIVRGLDRRHDLAAADRRPRRDPEAEAEEPASERKQATTLAPAKDAEAPVAPPVDRPEMAPQCVGRPARSRR
ncbi:MAG TPA: hypothetical protein VMS87_04060 [Roseiarcus sp.]|nr:hypothetical protein [Roseiarcus sp.]